jgi:hypothetical protein
MSEFPDGAPFINCAEQDFCGRFALFSSTFRPRETT